MDLAHVSLLSTDLAANDPDPALVIALLVSASLNVAFPAGLLSHRAGAHPANAVIRAGAAFAGALALLVTMVVAFRSV
jgi:hypothetical protein